MDGINKKPSNKKSSGLDGPMSNFGSNSAKPKFSDLKNSTKEPSRVSDETVGDKINQTGIEDSNPEVPEISPTKVSKNDEDLEEAINDIVKRESDKALEAEDKEIKKAFEEKPGLVAKLKGYYQSWWENKKLRYSTMAGAGALFILLLIIPITRYGILNAIGVRASVNLVVVDESTQQPLKNVDVDIRGDIKQTDIDGRVTFNKVKLGDNEIKITKIAYAESIEKVRFGTGNHDLGAFNLTPTGTQFSFKILDWLSEQPVEKSEVTFDENSAVVDENGLAILTIPPTSSELIKVTITSPKYKDQEVEVSTLNEEEIPVRMVLDRKHYYVSNAEDGKYNVYSSELDGENPQLLVRGTGKERNDIRFSVAPNNQKAALVSTREGARNNDGFLLSQLNSIDLTTDDFNQIDESERIDIVGWIYENLIYVKVAAGASGSNPERHRLMSYNFETGKSTQIAASNYFNDVAVINDRIYYAPSDAYKKDPKAYLFMSDREGNKEEVHQTEVWTIIRQDFSTVVFDAIGTWYSTKVGTQSTEQLDGPPSVRQSRYYVLNEDRTKALWTDIRDGKGVLLVYDIDSKEDTVVARMGGLRNPVHWVSSKHVVFRVVNDDEVADYIVNVDGGDPVKIKDVSNVSGVDRWYYYY